MSSLSQPAPGGLDYSVDENGNGDAPYGPRGTALVSSWNKRRKDGMQSRRAYEPTWHVCQSFLAGRQWIEWASQSNYGRVVAMPNPRKRERHTVNVLTQYVQTVLGKLYVEDLRPDLLFRRMDQESESIATHTQAVSKFLWDSEVDADAKLYDMILKMACYGTAGLRCFFDANQGRQIAEVPIGPDGQPIVDPAAAMQYVAGLQQQGQQAQFKVIREGRVCWESLSPFNFIPPAGIEDDERFPWLIVERPVPIEWAKMRYPDAAGRLSAQNIQTITSAPTGSPLDGIQESPASTSKPKDHVLVSIGYEMPTEEFPKGREVTWASHGSVILEIKDQLPYELKGRPHTGIVFFHYHRVPGRFFSVGAVEPLVGPQRQKNRARSQMIEMKDRNLGRVYAKKGTMTAQNKPVGKIMEVIEIPLHADYPQETNGVPVGAWIENEARINDEDMDRVSGLREVSMGQSPAGVSAYSAMALLAEQDDRRVGPILKMLRGGIADAVLLSLELAKRYWPQGKQFAIAGQDGVMEMFNYERSMLPQDFYVHITQNAPLPTSPAAEAQKIFDIFNAAIGSGQPLPIDWLKGSLDAGRAMPIPKREEQVQITKADQENLLMSMGQFINPDYWDDDYVHIQIHRQAQMEYGMAQKSQQTQAGQPQQQPGPADLIEAHIQMHMQNAQQKRPTAADAVPSAQGGHGVEAQNGPNANMQGVAQQPGVMPRGGMAQGGPPPS